MKGKLIIGFFQKYFLHFGLFFFDKVMSLNTVLNFLILSGKHFRRKKFSQEEIFATWCLIVKISKNSASQNFLTIWYMGQLCIEITDYSVFVFDHIVAFNALYCWTSIKGGAHTCCVNVLIIHSAYMLHGLVRYSHIYEARMNPALMEFQWYGVLNAMMRSKYAME